MTAALLLAEPEPATRGYLERQLASDGFHVLQAAFGGEALALAERTRPDLVVCSELDLCARLREGEPGRTWNRDVPVIVLGPEEADAVDRVRAFQRGADDYLPRPVVYDELLARIRAVLRRTSPPCPDLIEVGELAIDRLARVVTVRGEPVHLAGKEFELLVALAAEPNSRVHEGRAASRRLGIPLVHADPHARLARLTAAAEARASAGRPLRRQRVGSGLQARRLTRRVALVGRAQRPCHAGCPCPWASRRRRSCSGKGRHP